MSNNAKATNMFATCHAYIFTYHANSMFLRAPKRNYSFLDQHSMKNACKNAMNAYNCVYKNTCMLQLGDEGVQKRTIINHDLRASETPPDTIFCIFLSTSFGTPNVRHSTDETDDGRQESPHVLIGDLSYYSGAHRLHTTPTQLTKITFFLLSVF